MFQTEGPAYYCSYAPTAKSTDVSDAAINELFPLSAPTSGALRCGVLPRYVNPVAANPPASTLRVAANAASAFPGPFGPIETWGRTMRYVALQPCGTAATYHRHWPRSVSLPAERDHHVGGGQHGRRPRCSEVTAISHTVVGATANTVSVGIGPALGVPFSFQQVGKSLSMAWRNS